MIEYPSLWDKVCMKINLKQFNGKRTILALWPILIFSAGCFSDNSPVKRPVSTTQSVSETSTLELVTYYRNQKYPMVIKSAQALLKLEENNLVSVDFISNKCPSIVDKNASMELFDNEFKLMIWYDNEWSYSNKLIKLVEHIYKHNTKEKENNKYFITNNNFEDKRVVLRLDWNVPILNDRITDYYRISSSLKTIKYILSKNPKYILIVSHLGRPKNKEEKYSWKKYIEQINIQLGKDFPTINLLEDGVSQNTLETLNKFIKNIDNSNLFLLENIRFHDEETKK